MKCFISRELEDWADVITACADLPVQWHCQSLIRLTPLSFELPRGDFDWVFFSSKEAVKSFFSIQPPSHHLKFAAIGKATARALATHVQPSFIGQSKDTQEVGKSFAQHIGAAKVLFPISDISLRTIQQQLPAEQVLDLIVYSTAHVEVIIPEKDLYIFTSPSNVEAYFNHNQLPQKAQIAAFGASTASHLSRFTDKTVVILDHPDPRKMAAAIKQNFLR
ncbi:MAG: hypothetical protein RLZZ262_866 [Bacteroidota bacterium]|jgi:hydroxymethylbilane synthase